MNDYDDHRFTNETYSSRNSVPRLVTGLAFTSAGLLASIFLSLTVIDNAPSVWASVAPLAQRYDPIERVDMVRELWDQKLDRLIENLTPD